MKVKDICKATIEQYEFISLKYPKSFRLFRNLCRKHLSSHKDINIGEVIDKSDELYVSDELGHSSFTIDDVNEFSSKGFENISPARY